MESKLKEKKNCVYLEVNNEGVFIGEGGVPFFL